MSAFKTYEDCRTDAIKKQLEGFREAMLIAAVDHEQAARSLFVAARNGLVDPELGPNLREHGQAAKALRAAADLLK